MESPKTQHFSEAAGRAPAWAVFIQKVICHCTFDLLGGPRFCTGIGVIFANFIAQSAVLIYWMWYYKNTSAVSLVYFALAIGHELAWVIKLYVFPDRSWQHKITIAGAVFFFIFLASYWIVGWYIISGHGHTDYPVSEHIWLCLSILVCIAGLSVFLMADAQKYFTQQYKKGLITDGMFRYIRHPNYLGEILIYSSLLMLSWHWVPTVYVVGMAFLILFGSNMALKEASMARYPEWAGYKKRSWWLMPGLF